MAGAALKSSCIRTLIAVAIAVLAALTGAALGSSKRPPAYCSIPTGNGDWGFHVGAPIQKTTGTYAHGHGTLSGRRATGIVCQVDRVHAAADRQIIVSVTKLISFQHAIIIFGEPGNRLRMQVKVKKSTDPLCAVGTVGRLTLQADYNGIHRDSVQFSFPKACRDHRHYYKGGSNVVVLIPPHT